MRLDGKTVVVTGAARGIGRRTAQMMVEQGARVLAVDIDRTGLATLAGCETCTADLTDEAAINELYEQASEFGQVHILVNAAGAVVFGFLEELSLEGWRKTLACEVDTVFLVTRALWPLLKDGKGSVINFASANAHVALNGSPAIAHVAGKGAVLSMTRQLAMEGGPHGIRANTISPGFIVTEETSQHLDDASFMSAVKSKLMVDRLGQTDDIGMLAIYLGSDESSFVTGADFKIDGGALAW